MNAEISVVGYALAGIAFLLLTLMILTRARGSSQTAWLAFATAVTALWGFALAASEQPFEGVTYSVFVVEIAHDSAWLLFLSILLGGAIGQKRYWLVRYAGLSFAALIFLAGTWANSGVPIGPFLPGMEGSLYFGSLLTALFVLIALEQIYRNARTSQRRGLKFLCLGIGTIFAYDIFLYSNAILSDAMSPLLWGVRGVIALMCVPLVRVATIRKPAWRTGMFVSRRVVFYTTTMIFAGIYLVTIGIAGYYIRTLGGHWGPAVQLIIFVAALLTLIVLLLSDRVRAKLRVYVAKHFFQSKYDYREEWLRLIDTLTLSGGDLPLRKRAIKSLAQVIDAPSGLLWMQLSDRSGYQCVAGWNVPRAEQAIAEDHSVVRFLTETGWIIDLGEYEESHDRYGSLTIDDQIPHREDTAYVIPLLDDEELLGFVFLMQPPTTQALNFEDHDLLKTAGKQIASYLSQELSTEQLAESRQFEAFNRLTAYLMHDLKNLIAQQSLVVENAQKHRDNPEFIDDAIETIRGGVQRLRRVIEHIQQRSAGQHSQRVELRQLIAQVVDQCGDRKPLPQARLRDESTWVWGDRERLLMAIYHAIRNAQEATPVDGRVSIELSVKNSKCVISVTDDGAGMEESFVRDRLFRPFDSTKGTQGMGIGAYQMRETVRAMGGDVAVSSKPGSGTVVSMTLRIADN